LISQFVGDYHNLALGADGTVVAWGLNGNGHVTVPWNLMNVLAIAPGVPLINTQDKT